MGDFLRNVTENKKVRKGLALSGVMGSLFTVGCGSEKVGATHNQPVKSGNAVAVVPALNHEQNNTQNTVVAQQNTDPTKLDGCDPQEVEEFLEARMRDEARFDVISFVSQEQVPVPVIAFDESDPSHILTNPLVIPCSTDQTKVALAGVELPYADPSKDTQSTYPVSVIEETVDDEVGYIGSTTDSIATKKTTVHFGTLPQSNPIGKARPNMKAFVTDDNMGAIGFSGDKGNLGTVKLKISIKTLLTRL